MRGFTPCLWFDDKAEDAANFYVSVFSAIRGSASPGKNSEIVKLTRYGEEGAKVSGRPKGSVMTVLFQLHGQEFLGLNGGPVFTFSPAISFIVNCETQEEVDWFWEKLAEGGKTDQCGWLTDKYGVSWQIVPTILSEMMQEKDARKAERVMKAMLQMKKIDITGLKKACEQQ
jgi:predicted 3-demethylubiquinone-9 3-methyltransferase (glyoxalase superfamily)